MLRRDVVVKEFNLFINFRIMVRASFIALFLFLITTMVDGQTIPLYPGKIPNSKVNVNMEKTEVRWGLTVISRITIPTLTIYLPDAAVANGTAVIVCPGGGYEINAIVHEGHDVAKEFVKMGVTAFVLKYRVPNDSTMTNKETGPLQDLQQAISYVRKNAQMYKLNRDRIGVIGFSAGGHLASTASTHYKFPVISSAGNVRPDFAVLVYPVISFNEEIGHAGSRERLIGTTPSPEKIKLYSNELQITPETPPTILIHASDDDAVKSENSIVYYQNLVRNKVPAELHIYQKGGHGFGMVNPTTEDKWIDRVKNSMHSNGWLARK